MRIGDWSSYVCSSDLHPRPARADQGHCLPARPHRRRDVARAPGARVWRGGRAMTHLTRVTLTCAVDRPTVWLRFGWPMHEDDPDGCHRHVYFRPGAVFARVERATPDRRQLSVLRAAGPGERVLRIAGIDPGAQLLLHATTTARTELDRKSTRPNSSH